MSGRLLLGLDIGTSKTTAVIGELISENELDVIGKGTVPSEGIRRGTVVNLERAAEAIRKAVEIAKKTPAVEMDRVFLAVGGPQLQSRTSNGLVTVRRGQIFRPKDVQRAIEQAQNYPINEDEKLLHVEPLEFRVDGQEGIHDPVGMAGRRLEVDVLLVTTAAGPLTNLKRAVEAAGLRIEGLAAAPYVAGLAVLEPEEHEMNTIVLDMGAGTTGIGYFREGRLAFAGALPLGSEMVSNDIAKLLKIPFEEAERIKKKYGVAIPDLADPELIIEIPQGGFAKGGIPAPELARIIRPRVREIFMLARKALEDAVGPVEVAASKLVLTGGGALLRGTEDLARREFGLPTRLGRPIGVQGLADQVGSPTCAVAVGLLRFGEKAPKPSRLPFGLKIARKAEEEPEGNSFWEKVKAFFKDFF